MAKLNAKWTGGDSGEGDSGVIGKKAMRRDCEAGGVARKLLDGVAEGVEERGRDAKRLARDHHLHPVEKRTCAAVVLATIWSPRTG